MKLFLLLIFIINLICISSQEDSKQSNVNDFIFPSNEINCIRHFNRTATGVDPVNAFLLAKMSEMMYPERLDYQIRYLLNDSKPLKHLSSTDELKQYPLIDNSNFRVAFEGRFAHYFGSGANDTLGKHPTFYYLVKSEIDTRHFLGIKSRTGVDPEIIVIDYDNLIIILFRGTDDVENIRFAEWKGTDFNVFKTRSDSVLNYSNVHKGFWNSFKLIKDDLFALLDSIDAKNKTIWVSGHSLGGAMALMSGVYLKKSGYPITNIYSFASPRTIGDKNFALLSESILPNRIHRFEYYLDPFCISTLPGYTDIGTRHWFDNATLSNFKYYPNCEERYILKKPFEFSKSPFANNEKTELSRINSESKDGLVTKLAIKLLYHNAQWSVKATYTLIPNELKSELPLIDDSYPFIYYGWDKAK